MATRRAAGFTRVTFTKGAEALVDGLFLNANNVVAVLGGVAEEATGKSGIFAEHLKQGQSTWPSLSESWREDKRKKGSRGAGRKFVFSGRVERAITQEGIRERGKALSFGSSADIYASVGAASVAFTSQGIMVRAKADGKKGQLRISFAGRLGHSSGFKKVRRELGKEAGLKYKTQGSKHALASISRAEARMKELNAERRKRGLKPIRKFGEVGSLGFIKRMGGASKMVLARGDENLGYANLVQTGAFRGIRYSRAGEKDLLVRPQHLGQLRARKALGALPKKYTVERGKAYPLLPLKPGEEARIRRIIERELGRLSRLYGLSMEVA